MLGLADSNDPTPPIRLGWGYTLPWIVLHALVGIGWIVWGSTHIGASFWDGLIFVLGGAVLVVTGAVRAVARRGERRLSRPAPDPESDGGTAGRP